MMCDFPCEGCQWYKLKYSLKREDIGGTTFLSYDTKWQCTNPSKQIDNR